MKTFFTQTTGMGLLLFIILSIYNIVLDIKDDVEHINKIEIIKKEVQEIQDNSLKVLELQRERGLSSIYLANATQKYALEMQKQRKKTDKVFHTPTLAKLRLLIDKKKEDREVIFNAYSELIRGLLLDTKSLTYKASDKTLKNELSVYNDLNSLQEILGQLRAKVGVVLSAGVMTQEQTKDIQRTNILFQHQLETTFINDLLSSYKYTRKISKTQCLKKTLLVSQHLPQELLKGDAKISAIKWFKLSTCAIDKINSLAQKQIVIINQYILQSIKEAKQKRLNNFLIWLAGFLVLSIFVYISLKRSKELLKEQAMLKNYKKAIDYSSMVLTSDKNGFITHINKTLSEKSGYSEDELVGKKYTVVFDKENSFSVSKSLMLHMKKGKSYSAIIKNKGKYGQVFWIDTFVVPILDDRGKLVEYISIGYDISETIRLNSEIQETQRELIYRLGEAVESRNKASGNHIKRVAHYSRLLAKLAKLSSKECNIIFAASSMHDVGKIAIPDAILLKPGPLNEEEWKKMKMHSEIGYKLFKDSNRELLQAAAHISYEHHEYYNGKGYPRGLSGEDISIFGRIVAIADVFDALGSVRPYKEAWPIEKIIALFEEESSKQFDPHLVKIFLKNIDKFREIQSRYIDK